MLELCKEILVKVAFDRFLFRKELVKAVSWINSDEIKQFETWTRENFGKKYPDEIDLAFKLKKVK